ncbi:prephenate dehydrogenase (NADP+) [Spirosomataceae bacterium TFI 002]|nr:prephenate dehydrogenase (NADP+) [Spirosomataceae bacterium TFI 002]
MIFGIIGLGDMGGAFAKIYAKAGFKVVASDLPEKFNSLSKEYQPLGVEVVENAISVAQSADILLFCVEAVKIGDVVKSVAASIRPNTIVGAQTSIKAPEIAAFEKYLAPNIPIVTVHSLHGPHVDPRGQILILINHRASDQQAKTALKFYKHTGSKIEVIGSHQEHDAMMADIQVVTHIGFESIGTSFMHRGIFPWENPIHANGLDNLKLILTLRIYSYKYHVYAGLAILNPYAERDVRVYAEVENELFGLMISEDEAAFRAIIQKAKDEIFSEKEGPLMLNDNLMANYSLNPSADHKPNSHLSLLSMAVTWTRLGSNPYKNLVCQTPPFKLRVGMVEYLFRNEELLEESIKAAIYDKSIRKDDLAFHTAVQEWAHIVESKDLKAYRKHFEKTKAFLADRLDAGRTISTLLIERLNKNEKS